MADATDLKSVDRKVVWVRLPPSAPINSITYKVVVDRIEFTQRSFTPLRDPISTEFVEDIVNLYSRESLKLMDVGGEASRQMRRLRQPNRHP